MGRCSFISCAGVVLITTCSGEVFVIYRSESLSSPKLLALQPVRPSNRSEAALLSRQLSKELENSEHIFRAEFELYNAAFEQVVFG